MYSHITLKYGGLNGKETRPIEHKFNEDEQREID